MKFDLTLATVLVFLVPGGLLLFGTPIDYVRLLDRWYIVAKPTDATQAGMLLSFIFLAGAVIDSLRTVTVQVIVNWIARRLGLSLTANFFNYINKDSLEVFTLINDRSNEYLRLNQNVTLALLIVTISQFSQHFLSWTAIIYLIFMLVWLGISVRSRRDLNIALQGFINAHGGPVAGANAGGGPGPAPVQYC
jgi:hypothetical protein